MWSYEIRKKQKQNPLVICLHTGIFWAFSKGTIAIAYENYIIIQPNLREAFACSLTEHWNNGWISRCLSMKCIYGIRLANHDHQKTTGFFSLNQELFFPWNQEFLYVLPTSCKNLLSISPIQEALVVCSDSQMLSVIFLEK